MRWRREPTTPRDRPEHPTDGIEFRHGLMMRELAELRVRVESLERAFFRSSMRPAVKTAGLSTAVAGAVVAVLELLRYAGIFRWTLP